ncbi:MAG: TonB-dependent receptor [Melioribacteraceae bacterium]|nr:TonB-dependent receptor [Melioribacteraceae bacterium]
MSIKFFKAVLFLLMLLNLLPLYAQHSCTISGTVKDINTGEYLLGANVYLKDTHIGNASDANGKYLINQVPEGTWTLVCSILNYIKVEQQIIIKDGENLTFNFLLQNDELTFGEVVVTATRNEALVTSISAATEVLTTKKLAESNAKNVGQALESVGGSLIKSYGALGSLQSISLRGSTDSQVLILIDGQRLNNAQQASVDLSTIPLEAIERIEVVKGGHAALYGSDAIGGVINVITKSMARKNKLDFRANGTFGTYNTKIFDASVGQGIRNFDYLISFNRSQTDGNFEFTNKAGMKDNMKNADTKSDNLFLKTGYLFNDNSRLSAFYKYRKSDNGSPGSIDYPNGSARNVIDNNHVSISYDGLTFDAFAVNLNAYFINDEHHYINPESWLGKEEHVYNSQGFGTILQFFTDLHDYGLLSYGYEFRSDNLESDYFVNGASQPFIGAHQRAVHSVYFQNDWSYKLDNSFSLKLIPAIRLDNYPEDAIGSQLSPKIGVAISNDSEWRGAVRGNLGRVFRAPTYNDLYWPEDTWTKGNPDLRPEKGTTYDFGFIIQFRSFGSWSVEATYFASKLDDLILWAPAAKWMPTNIAKASITGLESKMTWRGFDNILGLLVSYTNLSAKDDGNDPTTSGKYLIYRPKDKFDVIMNLNYGITSLNLFYNYVGKRFHDSQNKTEINNYELVNVNLGVTPKFGDVNLNLRFEINNLFNKEIQVTKGSPVPGREVRFSVGINGSITGFKF